MRRIRRFYWIFIRRYRYEICGECCGGPAQETIHRYGCGRPVRLVWTAETEYWHLMVTGRLLFAGRTEGAGGVLCIDCFDKLCRDRGTIRFWKADAL